MCCITLHNSWLAARVTDEAWTVDSSHFSNSHFSYSSSLISVRLAVDLPILPRSCNHFHCTYIGENKDINWPSSLLSFIIRVVGKHAWIPLWLWEKWGIFQWTSKLCFLLCFWSSVHSILCHSLIAPGGMLSGCTHLGQQGVAQMVNCYKIILWFSRDHDLIFMPVN